MFDDLIIIHLKLDIQPPLHPHSSALMSEPLTLEEFENMLDSQIEVNEDCYGPWMMRVHMRRWRYQQLFPHLPLGKPDQAGQCVQSVS